MGDMQLFRIYKSIEPGCLQFVLPSLDSLLANPISRIFYGYLTFSPAYTNELKSLNYILISKDIVIETLRNLKTNGYELVPLKN